jgi:hypothetical protein
MKISLFGLWDARIQNLKQFNHRAYIRKGFVFEKYMNMCADPEDNALFNSGPLNKPVF